MVAARTEGALPEMSTVKKTPTIQDVARFAKVSTATVSRALSSPERVSEGTKGARIEVSAIKVAAQVPCQREAGLLAAPGTGDAAAPALQQQVLALLNGIITGERMDVTSKSFPPEPAGRYNESSELTIPAGQLADRVDRRRVLAASLALQALVAGLRAAQTDRSPAPLARPFGELTIAYDHRVLEPRLWTVAQSRWVSDLLADATRVPDLVTRVRAADPGAPGTPHG